MNKCIWVFLVAAFLSIRFVDMASADPMSSDNYRIPTAVMSGGGGPMGSANFQMNSTLGQPTPIIEQGMDPYSDNYGLLPGFWYTLPADAAEAPVIDNIDYDGCISELCTSTMAVTATDPAGGNLSYVWTAEDGGSIIGSGDTVDFSPPNASLPPACLPFRVTVAVTSDESGLTTEQTVNITVKLAGDADGNGVVNILDKVVVRNQFGQSGCACPE